MIKTIVKPNFQLLQWFCFFTMKCNRFLFSERSEQWQTGTEKALVGYAVVFAFLISFAASCTA